MYNIQSFIFSFPNLMEHANKPRYTMASRSMYEHRIDFAALAMQYQSFNKQWDCPMSKITASTETNIVSRIMGSWTLATRRQCSQCAVVKLESIADLCRELTKSLLHRDFGILIDLPDDRLCPPVCS